MAQTMVSVTYTELLESLPLVLSELVRQRVLRFIQYRAPRLLVLGFLAQSDHTSESAGTTKKGTSTLLEQEHRWPGSALWARWFLRDVLFLRHSNPFEE